MLPPNRSGESRSQFDSEIVKQDQNESTDASRLVELGETQTELWHDRSNNVAYATIRIGKHSENHPLRSRHFQRLLEHRFFDKYQRPANPSSVANAISAIEAKALFKGEEFSPRLRIAGDDETVHIDLCNDQWQSLTVTCEGLTVNSQMPVKFVRRQAMESLPVPKGHNLELIRQYVNLRDEDYPLVLAWLLACLRPTGPYPLLVLSGEQGSAKSTTAKILRSLVDPNKSPIRAVPKNLQDLAIAANNGHVIGLDNLSSVPIWLSDGLCRIATGGGFATRALYANDEEVIFEAQRPVILTGIEDVATRADLADRAIAITLPTIPGYQLRTEKELWENYERDAPAIFGGLLQLLSAAIRNLPDVNLDCLPRMADFVSWSVAAEEAMGLEAGQWLNLYLANIDATNQGLVDDNLIIEVLHKLLSKELSVRTSQQWLQALNEIANDDLKRQKQWPNSARKLSGELRRLAPVMRATGIQIDFDSHSTRHRTMIAIGLADDVNSHAQQGRGVGGVDNLVLKPRTEIAATTDDEEATQNV